jgi:predicted SnoaL-like aldol condensation-catalyzing enzyme
MADSRKNKEVVTRFYNDVFIHHDLTKLDSYMRDDYIQHNQDCPQGKAGFVEFFDVIFRALPDFKYSLKKMVAEDDIVMAFSKTTGTHSGEPWLDQDADGAALDYDVVDIFRVQGGKIAEHWDVADTFTFFRQLGVIEKRLNS